MESKNRHIVVGYDALDNPRERFFGWIPYMKKQYIFFALNVLSLVFSLTIYPHLPAKMFWGWFPSCWLYQLIIVLFNTAMWGIYFYKYWTALDDPEDVRPDADAAAEHTGR